MPTTDPTIRNQLPVAALVPAYNEERGICAVVDTLLASGLFAQVICVSDGSTDGTVELLGQYGAQITLIAHAENRGKGHALAAGIRATAHEAIFFLDADLVGLSTEVLERALAPFLAGQCRAVLAPMHDQVLSLSGARVGHSVCGNRIYYRQDLLPFVDKMEQTGFGVEVFLNQALGHLPFQVVPLVGVSHHYKSQKGWPAEKVVSEFVREGYQVVNQMLKSKWAAYQKWLE